MNVITRELKGTCHFSVLFRSGVCIVCPWAAVIDAKHRCSYTHQIAGIAQLKGQA